MARLRLSLSSGDRAVARDLGVGSRSGLSGDLGQALMPFWNPAHPYLLIYVPAWHCFADFLLSGTYRALEPNTEWHPGSLGMRGQKGVRVKGGGRGENKADGERQRVGFEHETVPKGHVCAGQSLHDPGRLTTCKPQVSMR